MKLFILLSLFFLSGSLHAGEELKGCGAIPEEIVLYTPKMHRYVPKVGSAAELSPPALVRKRPLITRESETSFSEATPIKGSKPKLLFRAERFQKGRFYGKFYTSPSHYFYLGGFKALWWRADPRDAGIFAGSGIDF